MLSSLMGFFRLKAANVLPMHRSDISDDFDLVERVSDDPSEYCVINIEDLNEVPDVENQFNPELTQAEAEGLALHEQHVVTSIEVQKTEKQRHWERQYPKIFAKAVDSSGQLIEIRYVNKERQLAFWDKKRKGITYVHRGSRTDEIIHQRETLTITK